MPGIDSLISGGSSKAIGAGIGLATGLIQNIQAGKLKKKADAAMPDLIDPRQASFLSELNQKRKAIDTGADFGAGMNMVNTTNAATNNAIVNASGGDVGGTIQGLLQSQQGANMGTNNVIAQGQGQQLAYNSMFNDLNNKIAARQLQLEMYNSQQLRAEWAQKKQAANQNTNTAISGFASIAGGLGGGAGATPTPSNAASVNAVDPSFLYNK